MDFQCPCGHENFMTFEYWRRHKECPICKSNRYYRMNDSAPKSKGFRILAFDQASGISGWSVYDDDELIKYGAQDSGAIHSTEKIMKTKSWVANMIQMWKPDLVIFEDIQLQKNERGEEQVLTFKKLAHLQGVLQNYCYENGFIFKMAPPQTWRAHSKVKGSTRTDKKKSAQLIVKKLYDIKVTEDEADAILIGRWGVSDRKQNMMIQF